MLKTLQRSRQLAPGVAAPRPKKPPRPPRVKTDSATRGAASREPVVTLGRRQAEKDLTSRARKLGVRMTTEEISDAVSAMPYAWFIWERDKTDTRFAWIPPCRKEFDREEDWQW